MKLTFESWFTEIPETPVTNITFYIRLKILDTRFEGEKKLKLLLRHYWWRGREQIATWYWDGPHSPNHRVEVCWWHGQEFGTCSSNEQWAIFSRLCCVDFWKMWSALFSQHSGWERCLAFWLRGQPCSRSGSEVQQGCHIYRHTWASVWKLPLCWQWGAVICRWCRPSRKWPSMFTVAVCSWVWHCRDNSQCLWVWNCGSPVHL